MGHWTLDAMRQEANAAAPRIYTALDLTLRNASGAQTSYRFASVGGLPGLTTPGAEPRVIDWGQPPRYAVDVTSATIGRTEAAVTLADPDSSVRARLEAGHNRLAPAWLRYVVPSLTADIYEPVLTGILEDWHSTFGQVELFLRVDDRVLDTDVPRLPILRPDWPDLTGTMASWYGTYFPVVMGTHSALGLSGTGAVRCVPVAWTTGSVGWYAPMLGPAAAIARVYVAGALKTLTTHYTVSLETRGRKPITVIKFTAGNIPTADQAVTCDLSGADASGVALGGAVITNAVRQIRKFILDYGWTDWRGGEYPSATPTTATLDDGLWSDAASIADTLKHEGTLYVGGGKDQARVRDVLEDWCQTWRQYKFIWTRGGRLGIRHISLSHPGYRLERAAAFAAGTSRHEPAVVRSYHELAPMDPKRPDSSKIISRAAASHCYLHADFRGEAARQFEVTDPTAGESGRESFDMPASAARAV